MSELFSRKLKMILILTILICFTSLFSVTAQQICANEVGTSGGYNYDFWTDYEGTTCMTLGPGGSFGAEWTDCGNFLARKGYKYDYTQTHAELGIITCNYSCNYNPIGNSYLCVYGWMRDPVAEYYIVDGWGTWRPPGADSAGSITVDGGTYDIYRTMRSTYPGINTPYTYWSVRTEKKTSGIISVTRHFNAWENMGWELGKIYEISFAVEGYQSSGNADVTSMSLNVDPPDRTPTPVIKGDVNDDGEADIVDALLVAQYYVGLGVRLDEDAADVNCDGGVDIIDALMIAQYYVGLITGFC
ncbi:MAG: glycoside hydrolase family 11 protein [Spirochaetales bacterium]|nr:glycoside hydrolase family 11 protein [Spirochaetales bacterium]